jgi:alanine dehydrogenase
MMIIGVPAEIAATEDRVALTPDGAGMLVSEGHQVLVESGAGLGARFQDAEYRDAGAELLRVPDEIYGRADLIVKVAALLSPEIERLRRDQIVLAFHHLAVCSEARRSSLSRSGATLIAYEAIEDARGDLPVLHAMSAIAGPLAVDEAMRFLPPTHDERKPSPAGCRAGRGVDVVILGAGGVGWTAARTALTRRARVTVLDPDNDALRRVERTLGRGVSTRSAHPLEIWRAIGSADVLIGAVLVRGRRSPHVVSRTMVDAMKAGSVIVDVSIDQGGCVETSRPTSLDDPVYFEKRVTQYAVPNMASAVARTASLALTNAALPFVQALAWRGLREALERVPGLAAGVCLGRGAPDSPPFDHLPDVQSEALHGMVNVG